MTPLSVVGAVAQAVKPLNKGVPGVPLHALDAIPDENTRQVLRSIVDGWHVRNGASGTGDNRFVTSRELDAIAGRVGGLAGQISETRALVAGFDPFGPGQINRLIDDLHSQIFESELFKKLEERVDFIDKPGGIFDRLDIAENAITEEKTLRINGDSALATSLSAINLRVGKAETLITNETKLRIDGDTALANSLQTLGTRVGNAEAALVTETNQRVNADNALQTSVTTQFAAVNDSLSVVRNATTTNANSVAALTTTVNTVQASVGNLSAAVAAETTARVNADGTLFAQYTVKVDTNGYVSGFGLANTSRNGTPTSSFIVRADSFSIVSPTGNRAALIMTNNTISVYDENGRLRVRIGRIA
jgi:hypothetical protein